jgi:L-rhamnose-H+ transport protein
VWLAWSVIGLFLFPLGLTTATIPDVMHLYLRCGPAILAGVLVCGFVWGISQVLFGLGITRVGVGLGFAIVISLAAVTGALLPIFLNSETSGQTFSWPYFLAGIALALGGVVLCSLSFTRQEEGRTGNARLGLLFCIGAGVGGAMINVGMVAGGRLTQYAADQGVPPRDQVNAVWLPVLFAGFLSTTFYCAYLLNRNGGWQRFWGTHAIRYWLLALTMAVCWFGSVEIYGVGAAILGPTGPVLGWPIFLCSSIMTANLWGVATGEWRGRPTLAKQLVLGGVAVLAISMFVIASSRT